MAGRLQLVCDNHLCHLRNIPFLHTVEGRGQSQYDVVSFGYIFCIVRQSCATQTDKFTHSIYNFSKLLISLTVQYFKSEESIGERSTCIVTGLAYLLIAMIILIVDENTLEIGLEQAYKSFNESAAVYLEGRGISSS